jgi:F-type H+-transporting ATPase subunit b
MLLCVVSAHAAEGAAPNEHATDLFKWINFALVAGALIWVFGRLLPPIFNRRADSISAAIKKATEAKAEADRMLREAEQKLAKLENEIAQLRALTQREADAEKIEAAAAAEIDAAERAARLELKALAANLAVDGAESLLAKQLTPQAQEALVSAFVKGLAGRPN